MHHPSRGVQFEWSLREGVEYPIRTNSCEKEYLARLSLFMSEKKDNNAVMIRDFRTAVLVMVVLCFFFSAEFAKNTCAIVWALFFCKKVVTSQYMRVGAFDVF